MALRRRDAYTPDLDWGEPHTLTAQGLHAGRDIHLALHQGIPPELFQRLTAELGVTKASLTSFFKILEQQSVPLEDLKATLREIATRYNTLLERVRTLSADDPHIIQRIDATETAIHEGDFDRAEQLIND